MKKMSTRTIAYSGLFVALGMLLPMLTGQIKSIGNMLLPMHIPVLLCGFICGWPAGLLVGFVTPLLRSVLFGMPPMMPTALAMAFELAVYGAAAGLLSGRLPRKLPYTYLSLVIAMLAGRIVWGLVSFLLFKALGNAFTWKLFFAQAFLNAFPGILLQLAVIPPLAAVLTKGGRKGHDDDGN